MVILVPTVITAVNGCDGAIATERGDPQDALLKRVIYMFVNSPLFIPGNTATELDSVPFWAKIWRCSVIIEQVVEHRAERMCRCDELCCMELCVALRKLSLLSSP